MSSTRCARDCSNRPQQRCANVAPPPLRPAPLRSTLLTPLHASLRSLIHWFIDLMIHWLGGSRWFTDTFCFTESAAHWFVDSCHVLTESLLHWFIDSQTHAFIDSQIHRLIDLVNHRITDFPIYWFTDSFGVSFIHWFSVHWIIDSLMHLFSHCHWHLNRRLLIRWCTSQLQYVNMSLLLLHLKQFPIGHWFLMVGLQCSKLPHKNSQADAVLLYMFVGHFGGSGPRIKWEILTQSHTPIVRIEQIHHLILLGGVSQELSLG